MTRVKRGVASHRRHKKVLKAAKGYRGVRGRLFKCAKQAVMKAGLHAYRDRKLRKRNMRQLWTARISAALRARGTKYSVFMGKCFKKDIRLNRKMLAELAAREPEIFDKVVDQISA
ncbi:50S ribosomal protein L20 [Candidatus Peregrinibacteria bacterium]|jgi:large subunit ribosomal protein L20|nr:50S ribosomal protein L20 [Candidatus Peregrinibacteria bacterium]